MFDRLSKGEKVVAVVVGMIAVVGGIVTPAITFGEIRSDVKNLQRDYGSLESRIAELEKPQARTAKGDLCGKLIDGLVDASSDAVRGPYRQEALRDMAIKMDCFSGVPAADTRRIADEVPRAPQNAIQLDNSEAR